MCFKILWICSFRQLQRLKRQAERYDLTNDNKRQITCGKTIGLVSTVEGIERRTETLRIALRVGHKLRLDVLVERLNVPERIERRRWQVRVRVHVLTTGLVALVAVKAGRVGDLAARHLCYVRQSLAVARPIRTVPMITCQSTRCVSLYIYKGISGESQRSSLSLCWNTVIR